MLATLAMACGGGGGSAKPVTTVAGASSTGPSASGQQLPLVDELDDDRNGWGTESGPQVDVAMRGGLYVWDVRQEPRYAVEHFPDALVAAAKAGELDNVRIEARVSFTSPGSALLGCYQAPEADIAPESTGYFFAVLPEGHAVISEGSPGGAQRLVSTAADPDNPTTTPSVFDFAEGKPLTFAAECQRRRDQSVDLRLFVNGRQVLQTTDTTPQPSGIVSLGAGKSPAALKRLGGFRPYTVSWERVRVDQLT